MNSIAFLLMFGAVALLIFLLRNWVRNGPIKSGHQSFYQKRAGYSDQKFASSPSLKQKASTSKSGLTSQEKGRLFEEYIAFLMPKSSEYRLRDWRGDKFHRGIYAESNRHPDLEYSYTSQNFNFQFALECKWRSTFLNGEVKLGEDYQLKHYQRYSKERQIQVFILLGIGGKPNKPDELYIIPLNNLSTNFVTRDEVKQFKKNAENAPLYLDYQDFKSK